MKKAIEEYRNFLKDSVRLSIDFSQTDQGRGIPPPPIEKPFGENSKRIDLIVKNNWQNIASAHP